MRKFITKVLSGIMTAAMAFTLLATSVTVKAAETSTLNYVALGDSITEGHIYVDIIGKSIGATSVKNFGVSGWTSSDIYTQVRTATDVRAALKKADVVTLDIGSNDIVYAIGDIICDTLPCGKSYEAFNAKITSMQRDFNKASGFQKMYLGMQMMYKAYQVHNAVYSSANINATNNTFKSNLTGIIKEVKALSPKAKIYVGNLYNPYNGSADISIGSYKIVNPGEVVELWETIFNKNISTVVNNTGCKLVNIHPLFTDTSLLLGDAKNNWDPHPNQKGHEAIANAFLKVMK